MLILFTLVCFFFFLSGTFLFSDSLMLLSCLVVLARCGAMEIDLFYDFRFLELHPFPTWSWVLLYIYVISLMIEELGLCGIRLECVGYVMLCKYFLFSFINCLKKISFDFGFNLTHISSSLFLTICWLGLFNL